LMYNNPRDLLIGERIRFRRTCAPDYFRPALRGSDLKRQLYYDSNQRGYGSVIGCVKRALGTYIPKTVGHYNLGGEDDSQPARLKVSEYIWLYQVRQTIAGPIWLVHPDDIVIPDDTCAGGS
jgi:hypothetical protein